MTILALLLNESLDPPRDVHGDGYADIIVTHEAPRRPMDEMTARLYDRRIARAGTWQS